MITLYRKNASGAIGTWRIWSENHIIYFASCQVENGAEILHCEHVTTNQSGRSLDEQVALRISSRVSKVRDKGYKDSADEAAVDSSNQLGLDRPMLAQSIKRVSNVDYTDAVVQKKLDGHRCLITCVGGQLIAYSRQGKPVLTIGHILDELDGRIPEGMVIDGELYHHGSPLQTIASWVKRKQENTLKLMWVGYDVIDDDTYTMRHIQLTDILKGLKNSKALGYSTYTSAEHLQHNLKKVRSEGFEGLIVRIANRPYETGKRSSALIKVKVFEDAEFVVIDVVPSTEGWGKCVCVTDKGLEFTVSAPGNVPEKTEVLENKASYIGKSLTVEYACLTNRGIPFHAVAIRWLVQI